MPIRIKRVYDPPDHRDGTRILVEVAKVSAAMVPNFHPQQFTARPKHCAQRG
jgi:hypothetical protein